MAEREESMEWLEEWEPQEREFVLAFASVLDVLFQGLQELIADASVPEYSWETPAAKLLYPVAWDWDAHRISLNTIPPEDVRFDSPTDRTGLLLRALEVETLARLTNHVATLIQDGKDRSLLPLPISEAFAELSEDECEKAAAELYEPFAFGIEPGEPDAEFDDATFIYSGKFDTGEEFSAALIAEFFPLEVNADERLAYYPVEVSVNFGVGAPAKWTEQQQAEFWEGLSAHLEKMASYKTFEEFLASRLEITLPAAEKQRRARAAKTQSLPDLLQFPADRIHKGAVEGFSHMPDWKAQDGFFAGYRVSAAAPDKFSMLFGFRENPGPALWDFLLSRGPAAIKAHYALSARYYETTGGRPGEWAVIDLNQFLSDLGYAKAKNGGYKRERKQEAMMLLKVMTSAELAVQFATVGKNPKTRQIRGTIWTRGLVAEERDEYADLLGRVREGSPDLWDPVSFSYGPGPWFSDPAWRKQNRFMGLIGAGLMKLRNDTDQTAILVGGYIGSLGRMERYHPLRVRVATLLERIGMAKSYPRNPGKLQEKIEEAFDKLIEVDLLARWEYTDAEPDEPDMDDPEALGALADFKEVPWRRKTIEITWPAAMTQETGRLERARQKALQKARQKALQAPTTPTR